MTIVISPNFNHAIIGGIEFVRFASNGDYVNRMHCDNGHEYCADGNAPWSHRHCQMVSIERNGCGMTFESTTVPSHDTWACESCNPSESYDSGWHDDDDEYADCRAGNSASVSGTSVTDTGISLSGISHKHVVTDDNGNRYVLKSMSDEEARAEFVMPQIFAHAGIHAHMVTMLSWDDMGLCDYCTSGNNPLTRDYESRTPVLCTWVEDFEEGRPYSIGRAYMLDAIATSIIDYLVANDDRHSGNYGHVNNVMAIIDNGLAFNNHRRMQDYNEYVSFSGLYSYFNSLTMKDTLDIIHRVMDGMVHGATLVDNVERDIIIERLSRLTDGFMEEYDRYVGHRSMMVRSYLNGAISRMAKAFGL